MSTDLAITSVPAALPDVKHRIRLNGVCSINGGPDHACTAVEVSLRSLTLETQTSVAFLDEAIVNLPHLGIIEAIVADISDGRFELHFEPAPHSKLGIFVTWVEGAATSSEQANREGRRFERIVPIKRLTTLHRDGEAPSMVRIIDLSRSGAAFTTSKALVEGERVRLGAYAGRVFRLTEGGAAVGFDRLIDEKDFDVLIDLDAAAPTETLAGSAGPSF